MDSEGIFLIKGVGICLGTLENILYFWSGSDVPSPMYNTENVQVIQVPSAFKLLVVYLKARYENELFIHTQNA